MDVHGCSFITFFKMVKEYETTVLVIEDEHGYKFGGFCLDEWRQNIGFFGNGENLLFTFKDQQLPEVFDYTGTGDQHMYASSNSIGLGGSHSKGRFALHLSDYLKKGSSVPVESYGNITLSKKQDFKCYHFEVWALLD